MLYLETSSLKHVILSPDHAENKYFKQFSLKKLIQKTKLHFGSQNKKTHEIIKAECK